MKVDLFDFELPAKLIAQYPVTPRSSSRLMSIGKNGELNHGVFTDIKQLLPRDSILVFNDTRVIPARLFTRKKTGGSVELLLTKGNGNIWKSIFKASRRPKKGEELNVINNEGGLSSPITVLESGTAREITLKFPCEGEIWDFLEEWGHIPLPPYIERPDADTDRSTYQTVYARKAGAVAAPTAGLHFTPELISELENNGITIAYITLHVGIGTFAPVKVSDTDDHEMHTEFFNIPSGVADLINNAHPKQKIIAVGTTSLRALEGAASGKRKLNAGSGDTDIFITPPYDFKIVDGLLTNFHLPKSTLLMLVSALRTREIIMESYKKAIKMKYRFFSYGDAMLLL
ncbi:MAG: tRNA preQ1(34) S-adenosylmethionine ribosyltransferase-isomerase QueA [Deltaproteobacteria bacterium]|nr:tRNA preQ1(34) S-adenosylmethionine ribosyltransferase-isomerase QueA [Deltaproteobacteria bacterium]